MSNEEGDNLISSLVYGDNVEVDNVVPANITVRKSANRVARVKNDGRPDRRFLANRESTLNLNV